MPPTETPADQITEVTPAGWYPDPTAPGSERYWDGLQWTATTRVASPATAPSQADIEAEAAARRAAEPPIPAVHDLTATAAIAPTAATPSVPAAPAAPEPPRPVVDGGAAAPAPAPSAVPAGPASPSPDVTAPAARVMDPAWPFKGYAGPQPWEAENPPTLTQNHLMLSPGASGAEVVELAALLGRLGYGSSITAGQNPHAIYDDSLVRAVQALEREYGVSEDPAVIRARTAETVGPWLWEAIVRAAHKAPAEAPEQSA